MAAMKMRSGKLQVTSATGIPRGSWLQIGDGDEAELARVQAVHGTTLKIGRIYWWHRAWWWLLAVLVALGLWLRWGPCAAVGHRVTRDASIGLRHCWCRRRWEDGAFWDDDDEESYT